MADNWGDNWISREPINATHTDEYAAGFSGCWLRATPQHAECQHHQEGPDARMPGFQQAPGQTASEFPNAR